VLGKLILQSWKESLESNNPKAAAWSCIINGCSAEFLKKYEKSVPGLVDGILMNNDTKRMRDMIAHATSAAAELITKEHAEHVQCPTQIISSSLDRLAGMGSEKELADAIPSSRYDSIEDCGHMSPFEQPVKWRSLALDFIDGKDHSNRAQEA
jgi:pimeloyl-ACP methyl ester carboxylesterase